MGSVDDDETIGPREGLNRSGGEPIVLQHRHGISPANVTAAGSPQR